MILRSFLFSLQASYRFLISTYYFAHLRDFSAENIIPDLLCSAISISKSLLGPWLLYIIELNSFTIALKTSF